MAEHITRRCDMRHGDLGVTVGLCESGNEETFRRIEGGMGVSTEFVEGGRGLLIRGSGTVTGSEIIECKERLKAGSGDASPAAFALIDLEAVKELRVTPEEVRRIASIDEALAKVVPDAVVAVAAPSDHVFGIARMWESSAEGTGWRTAVFRSREQAEAWLAEELCSPGQK